MGYSNRPAAIEQVRPYLEEMLHTDEEIVWITKEPEKFRYQLFQALNAAASLASEAEEGSRINQYAQLKVKFKIKTKGTKVIAEPRLMLVETRNFDSRPSRLSIKELVDTASIVETLNKYNERNEILIDFEGNQPEFELEKLYPVAQKYGFSIVPSSRNILFTKREEDKDIAWTPEAR